MSEPIVSIEKVTKDFQLGRNTIRALRDINLSVEEGEFMAIAGPSGSGKSTLLNLIGCIERPTSGVVKLGGADVTRLSSNELAEVRARKLGFIFQTFNLLPVLTVSENIEFPLHLKGMSGGQKRDLVARAVREVGLENFSARKPAELSGGQRQRVAIARALVGAPSIILADEPTANLDHRTGAEILTLMQGINKRLGTTFIFSTHDSKIMSMAGRVVELMDGEILRDDVS